MERPLDQELIWFTQRSRTGKVDFAIARGRIRVSGKRGGVVIDVDLPHGALSPQFQHRKRRSNVFFLPPLGAALVAATICIELLRAPWWAIMLFAPFIVPLTVAFLIQGIRNIAPLEWVTFSTLEEKPVFDVFREKNQALEFDQFIDQLCAAIRTSIPT